MCVQNELMTCNKMMLCFTEQRQEAERHGGTIISFYLILNMYIYIYIYILYLILGWAALQIHAFIILDNRFPINHQIESFFIQHSFGWNIILSYLCCHCSWPFDFNLQLISFIGAHKSQTQKSWMFVIFLSKMKSLVVNKVEGKYVRSCLIT